MNEREALVLFIYGELTWSGRGRQPKWIAEFLVKGGKIESLAI
jgi:DNA-binding protein H-NS